MDYFLWIVKAGHEKLLESEDGIAPVYTPPHPGADVARALKNAIVFVIVRRNRVDVLLKKIFVWRVAELLDEGTKSPTGQLELYADLLKSFAMSVNFCEGRRDFSVSCARSFNEGFSKIPKEIAEELHATVMRKFEQKFLSFALQNRFALGSLDRAPFFTAEHLLREVVRNVPLNRIWGDGRHRKNPFLNFALSCAEYFRFPQSAIERLPTLCAEVISLDPEINIEAFNVDVEFERIVPERIFARRFVEPVSSERRLDSVKKTEEAEKRHQEMLRDLSVFFASREMEPLQSRSVDLAIRKNGTLFVFEIKTTNSENVFAQVARGAFQLGAYASALRREGESDVRKMLVLEEDFLSDKTRSILLNIAHELSMDLLFYDVRREWPNKLFPAFEPN